MYSFRLNKGNIFSKWIPKGSIFLIDLTLSHQTFVPAKNPQSRAEMNEVEWKSLTLKYEGQQSETKELPQQSQG